VRGARSSDDGELGAGWSVASLGAFALVLGAYFPFRFGGRWAETDSAGQAASIRAMVTEATLIPNESLYSNGYLFSVVSTFLLAFTGLSTAQLLQWLYPLISASLVLIAWPAYRELTGSARAATLATVLLFAQPEFLFVILRGSHERVLRALLFGSLFLLAWSVRRLSSGRSSPMDLLLFHVTLYGIIATNSFFGSSYMAAFFVALAGSWFAVYLGPSLAAVSSVMRRRLLYVPILALVFVSLFNDYVYPPAGQASRQVPDILDRLQRLFLTTSSDTSVASYDPYAGVLEQWIDFKVYLLLSVGTFTLMGASAVLWARQGLRWLARKDTSPTIGQWLLWLMFGAFALQGALSIVADRTGALGGNLQHRTFPSFAMVGTPVVAAALVQWRPGARLRRLAAIGLGVLALLAVIKATNEPAVSNKWTFYLPAELEAARFIGLHSNRQLTWTDFDERLGAMVGVENIPGVTWTGILRPTLRLYLVTDVTRLRSVRLGRPLPPVSGELRLYDNGAAQIYRTRSSSPYQQ
jgi:hypothetical protein